LDNFNKSNCEIKILYEGAGRKYGGGGNICPDLRYQLWLAHEFRWSNQLEPDLITCMVWNIREP